MVSTSSECTDRHVARGWRHSSAGPANGSVRGWRAARRPALGWLAVFSLALAGCGSGDDAADPSASPVASSATSSASATTSSATSSTGATSSAAGRIDVERTFAQWSDGAQAVTYDTAGVPVGARASVEVEPEGSGTKVELEVHGLQPNRTYGAHIHVKQCGQTGDAAGPHYQNEKDPVSPSTDPAYANNRNEVWLDFTTDAQGEGESSSTVAWQFRADEGRALVIHAQSTATHAGHAGTAGARLACLTLF